MLVSHRKRFIYTKTAKTAGTSVEVYFEPYCLADGAWTFSHSRPETVTPAGIIGYRGNDRGAARWWHHMSAADIRRGVGADTWDSYFKFCVIRDPFDKAVSAFHFFHLRYQPETGADGGLPARFKAWIRSGGLPIDRENYTIDGRICMDHFIRYELLEEGVRTVCQRLGVDFEPARIPRLKSGFRAERPLQDYYDDEAVALVRDAYRFELEQFRYGPPC